VACGVISRDLSVVEIIAWAARVEEEERLFKPACGRLLMALAMLGALGAADLPASAQELPLPRLDEDASPSRPPLEAAPRYREGIEERPEVEAAAAPVDDEASDEDDEGRKRWSFGARLGGWLAEIGVEVNIPRGALLGTDIDLESDLDLDEPAVIRQGEVFMTSSYVALRFDYFAFEQDSSATLDANLSFAGVAFQAGLPVETELEVESAALRVVVTPFSFEYLELGAVIGARYYRASGRISARNLALNGLFTAPEASDTVEVPLPLLGLSARVFLGMFELHGALQGFSLSYDLDDSVYDASYFELELGVRVNVGDHFAVGLGYRGLLLSLTERERDALAVGNERKQEYQVEQSGLTAELRLRF
jgi:hypothetical protein